MNTEKIDMHAQSWIRGVGDLITVASRPRFGGDSQALSWYRLAEMRPSWKGSAGQGPAIPDETGTRPREFPYVYKCQVVS
jgi:hypothetical protein